MKKKKHICELLLEYVTFLGIKRINEIDGLWVHQIDETWLIKCNGHQETIENVPGYCWAIEYNGWPAGILSVMGDGIMAMGMGANEHTLAEAINAKMNSK